MSSEKIEVPEIGHALGKHMTVEYYECDAKILADARAVEDAFIKAANESGATVIGSGFHHFEPQGVSGFVVIAESHFSVHAWPEFDYAAVDIFTCGESIDFHKAVSALKKYLKAQEVVISAVMNRGITNNDGMVKQIPLFDDKSHLYSLSWKSGYERTNAHGLSCNIDIYGGERPLLKDPAAVERFAAELFGAMALPDRGAKTVIEFTTDDNGDLNMMLMRGTFRLSGRFLASTGTVYLDIFSCDYYEPRDAAEFAIAFFSGSNYRMQVALRR